jgi:galactokinase
VRQGPPGLDRLLDACIAHMPHCAEAGRQVRAFWVPGRIELFGKHTDYAGGRSLLAAAERGFVIASAARNDDVVTIRDAASGEHAILAAADAHAPAPAPAPGWVAYPRAVLQRLRANFPAADGGADLVFASDLPQAAGLSSSSALVIATFLGLDAVLLVSATAGWRAAIRSDAELAGYLAAAESGADFGSFAGVAGVGTHGGSEDHAAILCAQPQHVVQFSFAPTRFERTVALPPGLAFVIGCSGVRAEKGGAARQHYNRLSADAQRIAELWRSSTGGDEPHLGAIVALGDGALAQLRQVIRRRAAAAERERLLARTEQFAVECTELIPGCVSALAHGDLTAIGALAERSTRLGAEALQNQVPETLQLARFATSLGAAAASPFGAGFGGSVWALIAAGEADAFRAAWRAAYIAEFPRHSADCTFFTTLAGPPASRLA